MLKMCLESEIEMNMKENNIHTFVCDAVESVEDKELAKQALSIMNPHSRNLTREEKDLMWANVVHKRMAIRYARKRRLATGIISAAAACIALIIGLFGLYNDHKETVNTQQAVSYVIENVVRPDINSSDIQVILSDNESIILKEKEADIVYDESGEAIIRSQSVEQQSAGNEQTDKTDSQPAYNQIIIPKGKRSTLTLSDGSKLWLNACTRVVYPPVFPEKEREIYIEGEAYLEVKPDAKRPFTVKTGKMDICVKGTSFNVMAYADEESQEVTLAEGSVSIRIKESAGTETILKPGQMLALTNKEATIKKVQTEEHISWKDGYYLCKYNDLSLILNRLSRYYGVEIRYGSEVGDMKFSGKLDLKNDPDRVMFGLMNAAPVECIKENNTYIINPLK